MESRLGDVLIVEDDTDAREMLATLVSAAGFHAVPAEDGLEALHLLRVARHGDRAIPCVILLDLNMPRFSGAQFRRAQLSDPLVAVVPVVVMSGAADADERGRALGAVETLAKPLDLDRVLRVVRAQCGSAASLRATGARRLVQTA